MKINFIIPTRNRKKSLLRLLHSINDQKNFPDEIIIIDTSDFRMLDSEINFKDLKVNYIFTTCRSLTKSKNIGISFIEKDTDFICFLDDDIVFEDNCILNLMNTLKNLDKSIAGISLNIIDAKRSNALYIKFFKKIFFMETFEDGKVLISGFNNPYCPTQTSNYSDWLCGGVTVWRRSIFFEYKFDEWFSGYGYCEDLDFSYRVGKKYKLFYLADAKVKHLMDYDKNGHNFYIGKMQSVNRLYFVKKNKELSLFICLYALIGQCLNNFFKFFLSFQIGYLIRSLGNFLGILIFFIKSFER